MGCPFAGFHVNCTNPFSKFMHPPNLPPDSNPLIPGSLIGLRPMSPEEVSPLSAPPFPAGERCAFVSLLPASLPQIPLDDMFFLHNPQDKGHSVMSFSILWMDEILHHIRDPGRIRCPCTNKRWFQPFCFDAPCFSLPTAGFSLPDPRRSARIRRTSTASGWTPPPRRGSCGSATRGDPRATRGGGGFEARGFVRSGAGQKEAWVEADNFRGLAFFARPTRGRHERQPGPRDAGDAPLRGDDVGRIFRF